MRVTNSQGFTLDMLRQRERHEHDGRARIRRQAVRLVGEGYPAVAVAHIVGMSAETVATYVRQWNTAGLRGLAAGQK